MRTGRKKVRLIKVLHMGYSECLKADVYLQLKKNCNNNSKNSSSKINWINKRKTRELEWVWCGQHSWVGIRSPQSKEFRFLTVVPEEKSDSQAVPLNPEFPFASILISEAEPLCLLLAEKIFKKMRNVVTEKFEIVYPKKKKTYLSSKTLRKFIYPLNKNRIVHKRNKQIT